jgi:hypothetical protein
MSIRHPETAEDKMAQVPLIGCGCLILALGAMAALVWWAML